MPEASEGNCHARRRRGRGAWGPRERVSNAQGECNSANVLDNLLVDREVRTGMRMQPKRPLVSAATGDTRTAGPTVPPRRRRRAREGGTRAMRNAGREATRRGRHRGRFARGDAGGGGGRPRWQDSNCDEYIEAHELTNNAQIGR